MFNLIFMTFSTIVALTYFEPKMTSGNRTARQNSRGEVVFILNKVVCQILFSFLTQGNDWFFVLLLFFLSLGLHSVYNMGDPYYDEEVGKFYKVVTTYYLWTNFNLLLSQILSGTSFNGGLISWLIGLPFIVLIMITEKKSRIDTLIRSQMKFRSGEQIQGHLRYILQLIGDQKKDKNAYMLLIGYVEKHKEICQEEDCPLKQKKQKRKNVQENEMEETCLNLLKEIDRMYQNGLKKFPSCTSLRISYAFFLMERMKNKRDKSYQQFKIAETSKPSFDQQFIIYRYKKIMDENLDQIENESSENDIVKLIAFDSHLQQCEEYMKISAQMHKEFWAELKEENPALSKLNIIGSRISQTVHEARSHYNDIQKINPRVFQTIKVFGKFLINVLNDKENGLQLLEKAKQISQQEEQNEDKNNEGINEDYKSEPVAYSVITNKKGEYGYIQSINLLFCILFGYQKEELIGKKIQMIIPNLYQQIHETLLQRFYENITLGIFESNYIGIDQYKFGRNKNGYIFPIFYRVNLLLEDGYTFIVNYKVDKFIKNTFFLLTDQQGIITDISTSVILNFDMDYQMIKKNNIDIESIIPDWKTQNQFKERNGKQFTYLTNSHKEVVYNCTIYQIWLCINFLEEEIEENIHKNDIIGFTFKFDKIEKPTQEAKENTNNINYLNLHQKKVQENPQKQNNTPLVRPKNTNKQIDSSPNALNISYSLKQKQLFGKQIIQDQLDYSINNNNNNQSVDDFIIQAPAHITQMVINMYKKSESNHEDSDNLRTDDQQSEVIYVNLNQYDMGIRTKRLINNRIVNILEDDEAVISEDDQENSVFFNQIGDKYEDAEDYHIFNQTNSIQIIRKALSTNHNHSSVIAFKKTSLTWILLIIALIIFQYVFSYNRMKQYQLSLPVIKKINNRLVDENEIVSKIIDLINLQMYPQLRNIKNEQKIREDIGKIIDDINSINSELGNEKYLSYFQDFEIKTIKMRVFKYKNAIYIEKDIDLQNAIIVFASLSEKIGKIKTEEISLENEFVNTILFNFYNQLNEVLIKQLDHVFSFVSYEINQLEIELILALVIIIIITLFAIFFFIFLTLIIKSQRESILFLFLDIPQKHVFYLYKHCEKFLDSYISIKELMSKVQNKGLQDSSEDEEDDLEDQYIEQEMKNNNKKDKNDDENEESQEEQKKKRKKIINKYKQNKYQGSQFLIIKYILILIVTLIYSIVNIWSIFDQKRQILFLLPQFHQNNQLSNLFSYYLNTQKIMLINENYTVNGSFAVSQAFDNLKNLLGNTGKLRRFNLEILNQLPEFRDQYILVFYGNGCQFLTEITQCETIIDGNLKLGINNVIQHYFNVFQENLNKYYEIDKYQIISSKQFIELQDSLYSNFRNIVDYLLEYEVKLIFDGIESTINIQSLLVALFALMMFTSFILFWNPSINNMRLQLNQTIEMLNMMPIKVIKENVNIRRFVKALIKQMDKK
ncbi:PAS domain S-box family protein [Ichthyophthirius multifiliis]|uniref:PAS domain S-box family protein n=1 Tax=Ichthyophthirius multifiliis TaxID=5932 RepID=G0QNR3_ICHMU|nr:PAS domain S-box family protein [Ichthyophthirius multifiliis]EGR33143.1 PAS domain S-box family protein [Ichthyophthirius multifiliis]|eukprot:XP_004037129.1 PAS domain S-box family protein [Ichthyophthirius multifiliis]